MNLVDLDGCRPEPLGAYLKALGVLRLVATQGADPAARGQWTELDSFRLTTFLDGEALLCFLLDDYQPTPLVAPWNGGSGFDGRDAGIADIESSTQPRLRPYRDTIAVARRLFREHPLTGKDGKRNLLEACRAELPDEAVEWLDAAAVLTGGDPVYPALLGTGGNIGRLELSNNFMQRLGDVLCLRTGRRAAGRKESRLWLEAALFADRPVRHLRVAAGQFDPGRAGGILSSPLESLDKEGFVNPWDFVLALEGTLLFASAASRRMEAGRARPAVPFMVGASPVGYAGSAPDEGSKGELWAPLWRRPAGHGEVARLIGEGRAEWRGAQAGRGLDVARAAATLGVDRGVHAFVRHVFVERHGQNMLAVPVGRVEVRERPGVALLGPVDDWLAKVRRHAPLPVAVAGAVRTLEAAMYNATAAGPSPARMQSVLVAVSAAETSVGRSGGFRQRSGAPPVRHLPAAEWLATIDDGTSEVRLAAALASGRDGDGARLRWLLRPIEAEKGGGPDWTNRPPPVPGFGTAEVVGVLAAAHVRRMVERVASARGGPGGFHGDETIVGVQPAFPWALPCPLGDVARFVLGQTDDDRLGRLLGGFLLLELDRPTEADAPWALDDYDDGVAVDPAWRVLAPFFHVFTASSNRIVPEAAWPAQLVAGRVGDVVGRALLRLRMARRDPAVGALPPGSSAPGARLAAALLVPGPHRGLSMLLERAAPPLIDQ